MAVTTRGDRRRPGVGRAVAGMRGFTGRGIGVAVIDSGVDAPHPAPARPRRRSAGLHGRPTRPRRRRLRPRHARRGHHRRDGSGVAPGARIVNLQGARRGRLGADERRDRGDRLGDREPPRVQHPDHQPVARAPGVRVVSRRSAVPGGAARGRRRASWWSRRRATSARRRTAADRRRHHLAGQHAVGADGRRGEHAAHGARGPTT